VSGKLSSLRKRVAKVERQVAGRARREKLADCNCFPRGEKFPSLFSGPEEFEAAANLPCPVHGLRRLGKIGVLTMIKPGRIIAEESARLHQLVEEYELRLSQLPPPSSELEYDSEEL